VYRGGFPRDGARGASMSAAPHCATVSCCRDTVQVKVRSPHATRYLVSCQAKDPLGLVTEIWVKIPGLAETLTARPAAKRKGEAATAARWPRLRCEPDPRNEPDATFSIR